MGLYVIRAFYYRPRTRDGEGDRFLTFVEEPKPKDDPHRGEPSSSRRVWDRSSGILVGSAPTRSNGGIRDGSYRQVFAQDLRNAYGPLFEDGRDPDRPNLRSAHGGSELPQELRRRCEDELRRWRRQGRIRPDSWG